MKSVCLYLFRWRVFRCLFSTDCPVQKTSFQLRRAAWRYLLTPLRGSQDTKRRGFNDVGLLSKVLRLKNEMTKDITFIGHYNHHHHHHHNHHCQHHHRHNHPSQWSSNVRGRLYTVNVTQSALPPTSLSASSPSSLPASLPTTLPAFITNIVNTITIITASIITIIIVSIITNIVSIITVITASIITIITPTLPAPSSASLPASSPSSVLTKITHHA